MAGIPWCFRKGLFALFAPFWLPPFFPSVFDARLLLFLTAGQLHSQLQLQTRDFQKHLIFSQHNSTRSVRVRPSSQQAIAQSTVMAERKAEAEASHGGPKLGEQWLHFPRRTNENCSEHLLALDNLQRTKQA